MRLAVRSIGVALLALLAAIVLALTSTMTNVFTLAATVYIMKGTNSAFNQIPDSAYPPFAHDYIEAVNPPAPPLTPPGAYVIVPYPATFRPITPPGYIFSPTFDQSVAEGVSTLEQDRPLSSTTPGDILWGYSQGATVVTKYKRDYNAAYPGTGTTPPVAPTFVLVANPNRPNGGILERGVALGTVPILGVTFSGATPTQTAGVANCAARNCSTTITTYDIARQYDGVTDAPTNPLNVVADANAIMGFALLHSQYPNVNVSDQSNLIDQGTYGDTQYYLIPTTTLPLLMPVAMVPVVGPVVATTLDPALRVIVEAGYNRTISPGQPTPFNLLYFPSPAAFATNLLNAVPTGLDNGLAAAGVGRALGTTEVTNPYGVGRPDPSTGAQPDTVAPATTPAVQQATRNSPPIDTTATGATPALSDSPPVNSTKPTTPHRLVPLAAKPNTPHPHVPLAANPQVPLIRGPIVNGSTSLTGANDIASTVNGVAKKTTQAITGGITSVTSAAKSALSGATLKSPTSDAKDQRAASSP